MWICFAASMERGNLGGLKLHSLEKLLIFLQKCLQSRRCRYDDDFWRCRRERDAARQHWLTFYYVENLYWVCRRMCTMMNYAYCLWFICIKRRRWIPLFHHQCCEFGRTKSEWVNFDGSQSNLIWLRRRSRRLCVGALLSAQMKSLFDFSSYDNNKRFSPLTAKSSLLTLIPCSSWQSSTSSLFSSRKYPYILSDIIPNSVA